jgi:hypothetical protein
MIALKPQTWICLITACSCFFVTAVGDDKVESDGLLLNYDFRRKKNALKEKRAQKNALQKNALRRRLS